MAVKNVLVLMGQSNAEGEADKLLLPSSLRGVQANTYIFNYENNTRELLNVDGVGANLPNNTTFHTAGVCGPEMSLAAAAVAELGEIDLFKFAVPSSSLGPSSVYPVWNTEDLDLFPQFVIRWTAYVVLMSGLGHTINVIDVVWFQGETDSIIEGNDLAYFGLYKRFIKDIRTVLALYSTSVVIKWIACLIHRALLPPGLTYFIEWTQNVRGALRRAGWNDPYYRIVDTDRFSYKTDLFHLDTAGQVSCGTEVWEQHKSTLNNSMALGDCDLGSLRAYLSEEFGIDLTVLANATTIDKRINKAIAWIENRRKNWPWMERDVPIDVGERSTSLTDTRYGAGVFFQAQSQVLLCIFNLTAIGPREFVDFGGSGREGLLVNSYSGTTTLLRHGYRGDAQICAITAIAVGNPTLITVNLATAQGGTAVLPTHVSAFGVQISGTLLAPPVGALNGNLLATRISATQFSVPVNTIGSAVTTLGIAQIAREFVIAQGYFELPEDFIRESTAHLDSAVEDRTLNYKHPTLFEREVRATRFSTALSRLFTVVVDPLNSNTKKYLLVFPYFVARNLIHVKYFGDSKKLVADDDCPDVPRSDRMVVLYAAAWFVAAWQKDTDMITFYRDSALGELQRMTSEYQLSEDTTEDRPFNRDDLGPIRGPDGFPEFMDP